jgi:hypothetical protein
MPLPTELYEQILQDVDNRDLKNCRLASRQLEQSATPRLFRQIRIALSVFSTRALQHIASSERLRHHVRVIIWDGRKLPERWQKRVTDETVPLIRFIQPLSPGHKQILGEVYKRLCVEQYWLEKTEEPKTVLVENIPRFTNLSTLILSSRRSDVGTRGAWESQALPDALSSGLLRSYTTWALQACLCASNVTPKDNLPYFALAEALRGPRQEYTPPRYVPQSPYTSVKTLILNIDIDRAASIFSSRESGRHQAVPHAFRFLHAVSFTIILPHTDSERSDMPNHADAWSGRNARMTWDLSGLVPAPSLKKLAIHLPDHGYDFPTIPGHTAYPQITLYNPFPFSSLRHLTLSFCNTTAADITRFFHSHRRTLRTVHLQRIYLRTGRWTRVFEDAKKMNVVWEDVIFIGLLDACVSERVDCSEDVMRYLRGETEEAPFKGLGVRKGRVRDISIESDYEGDEEGAEQEE